MSTHRSTETMTLTEVNRLGVYNAEVSRGILHADWMVREMSVLQDKFDRLRAPGTIIKFVDDRKDPLAWPLTTGK